jgi:hypothetical protein
MYVIIVLIPSAIIGIIISYFIRNRLGIILAGAIPWFGILGILLYEEYFTPYKGGGASMWPVAQLFGGTGAAVSGIFAYVIFSEFIINKKQVKTKEK